MTSTILSTSRNLERKLEEAQSFNATRRSSQHLFAMSLRTNMEEDELSYYSLKTFLSHVKFTTKIADIIADHGHNVTLLQPYHVAMSAVEGLAKNKNIKIINYYPSHYEELQKTAAHTFPVFWDSPMINYPVLSAVMMPRIIGSSFKKTSQELIRDSNLIEELKNENFDVMLSETFDIAGAYLAHFMNIPCIPFLSAVRFPIFNEIFDQPSLIGYIPQPGSKLYPDAGFLDRLNDVYRVFLTRIAQNGITEYQNNFIEEAVGHPVPHWRDLIKESPVYFTNSNPYLDFAVPATKAIIPVGGITINLEKIQNVDALPEEYDAILNVRESTVLISFGSVINSYEMPESFKTGIIKMFHSLPDVTFIWKYEKDDKEFEKRLPQNVYLKKWVPQPSLLADSRLKVFVTHGGLGSTMEIAYSGKPALMIPIFGDQTHNAAMLARHGGAVTYNKFELPNDVKLANALKEIISNPKYEKNAKILREVLSNPPIDPKINLLNHLDFAIKFPNHRGQVSAINQANYIAHYYLDVLLFLLASAGLFIVLAIKLILRILRRFTAKTIKRD